MKTFVITGLQRTLSRNMSTFSCCCSVLFVLNLLTILPCCNSQQCSNQSPCSFKGGQPLKRVNELVSKNGALGVNLTVRMGNVTVEWLTTVRRTFDGTFPGPTWRIKAGDVVTVAVKNDLSPNQPSGTFNQPRLPNSTNIHTHGLHISPMAPADDVFIKIEPGKNYTYTYKIDAEQSPGLYWYHPHLHGSTLFQVESGMAGMIIVNDPTTSATPAHIQAVSCPDNCKHEIPLIFQPVLMYKGGRSDGFVKQQNNIKDYAGFRLNSKLEDHLTKSSSAINYFTTNGDLWPEVNITTGKIKRFRMVNAGGSAALELMLTDNSGKSTSGCEVREIAIDGVYLDEAVSPTLGKTFLVPSARTEWLVVCNAPGTYQIRSVNDMADVRSLANTQRYNEKLLIINVHGNSTSVTIPTSLPARASFNMDFRNLRQDQVTGRFVIEVDPSDRLNRESFISEDHFKFKMEEGTIQEWYFTNANTHSAHPIHIHVNHFQVISYNKYTGPYATHKNKELVFFDQNRTRCEAQMAGYQPSWPGKPVKKNNPHEYLGHETLWKKGGSGTLGYSRPGVFRDVIHVPPMSNITIRFKAHKYHGKAVIHCHLLEHEDEGMMFTVEIVKKGSDLKAFTKSGSGHPGQCKKSDPYPFNQAQTLVGIGNPSANTVGPKTTSGAERSHQTKFFAVAALLMIARSIG